MNAMCSVKQNDVKDHVVQMKKLGYNGTLTQTSGKSVATMEKSEARDEKAINFMVEHVKEYNYIIDLDSECIHTPGCEKAGYNTIKARLINLKTTGLEICSCVK